MMAEIILGTVVAASTCDAAFPGTQNEADAHSNLCREWTKQLDTIEP